MSVLTYRPAELANHRKELSDIRESLSDALTIESRGAQYASAHYSKLNRDKLDSMAIAKLSLLDVDSAAYYDSL